MTTKNIPEIIERLPTLEERKIELDKKDIEIAILENILSGVCQ